MSSTDGTDAATPASGAEGSSPLLSVSGVKKHFNTGGGLLSRSSEPVRAVDGVSFDVAAGETLAVVGESGCGKTTLGKVISRLQKPTEGQIVFDGTDISSLSNRKLRPIRRNLQVVYQDPTSSLNPRRRVKNIVADPLVVHDIGTKAERRERVVEMMELVDLPAEFIHRYPTELSGGQKQRVAIARALILNPKLVVLDEPTSALDVSVQAKVISLLEDLQERLDLTYVVISHDLSLVKNIADRIAVMYLGKFMEVGSSRQLFRNPLNPYTEQLLSAIPVVEGEERAMKPTSVKATGEPPDPIDPPSGCSFHPRCHKSFDACSAVEPCLTEREDGHQVKCLLYPGERAAEVDEYADEAERERMRADIGVDD
nr:oligopeptide/dipeptide ABC transporter ATP-binding protein [Halostella litorea]